MIEQNSRCLLCGARLTPEEFMNACTEIVHPGLDFIEAICPFCQGRMEIHPNDNRIDLGYCVGNNPSDFQVAKTLPFPALIVEHLDNPARLVVRNGEKRWVFPFNPENRLQQ